jgi:hypothetical protein
MQYIMVVIATSCELGPTCNFEVATVSGQAHDDIKRSRKVSIRLFRVGGNSLHHHDALEIRDWHAYYSFHYNECSGASVGCRHSRIIATNREAENATARAHGRRPINNQQKYIRQAEAHSRKSEQENSC